VLGGGACLAVLVAATMLAGAAAAPAAPGDKWRLVEHRRVPIEYYQGLTRAGARTFFVGIFRGGYLTDASLRRSKGRSNLIPASVGRDVGFNHIGDPTYDRAGKRLLLALECYQPLQRNPNTCGFGGFGVVDPVTLAWRYWVRLDRADVPKAMWVEISPDGELLWTSAGRDLVAYRTADVSPQNAASAATATPIRSVRRLRGAVPPSGANGGAFSGGKLLLSGSRRGVPQVWAVDLATGKSTLQLQLPGTRAEVEGIATTAGGGQLQWLLAPGVVSRPTYGSGHSELLTFVPVRYRVAATARLNGPTLTVHATLGYAGSGRVLPGATVRVGEEVRHTDRAGNARFRVAVSPPRPLRVRVAKGRLRGLTLTVTPRTATG
jgi:hypothetical protein